MVHHAVHASAADGEEQPWSPKFLEVAEVVLPVGLGHNGHAEALVL